MRPAVRQADQHARVRNDFLNQVEIEIQHGQGELGCQIVGQGQIEKGVKGIGAGLLTQLRNALP